MKKRKYLAVIGTMGSGKTTAAKLIAKVLKYQLLEENFGEVVDRIESRGRTYEAKIPQTYLELLDMLNHKWLSENKNIPILTILTDGLNIVRSKSAQKSLILQVKNKLR